MKTLVFESYGNNEIRIGFNDLPARARQDNDPSYVREGERSGRVAMTSHEQWLRDNKYLEVIDKDGRKYVGNLRDGFSVVEVDLSKLDIIREFQDTTDESVPTPKRGYGETVRPTSFSASARHRILEGGALFDRFLAKAHSGYFVTFTLPGSTPEAYDALSRWSGYMANRVLQCLRDYQRDTYWFYVWELQKRGALHLHLFLSLPKGQSSDVLNGRLRDVWYRALGDVQNQSGVDMFLHQDGKHYTPSEFYQYDFQAVETTPAQYISKYVGKNALAPRGRSGVEGGGFQYYPHRWWGMCRPLKQLIDEHRFQVCMDAMNSDECQQIVEDMSAFIEKCEPIARQEYTAEIGSSREEGQIIGVSHRRIYWFKSEDFATIDLLFRQLAIAWMQTKERHLQRWKYDSLKYCGIPIGEL